MLECIKNVFARVEKTSKQRAASPVRRQAFLGLESLEERAVPSVAPVGAQLPSTPLMTSAVVQTSQTTVSSNLKITTDLAIHRPPFLMMTNLSNVTFTLTSQSNGTTHQLQIVTQTNHINGTASFTGIWDGQNGGGGAAATGQRSRDSHGGIDITFTWGTNHSFTGLITGTAGHYHIDGNVTVQGGGGPGHVVGNEIMQSFVNVTFSMISLNNGTTHRLTIKTQTDFTNGTATFTGLWDANKGPGAPVTGTLSYDSAGHVVIHFTWGTNHSFAGLITGTAGHYHIDGNVTVQGGGGPGHVVGNQILVLHFPPIANVSQYFVLKLTK